MNRPNRISKTRVFAAITLLSAITLLGVMFLKSSIPSEIPLLASGTVKDFKDLPIAGARVSLLTENSPPFRITSFTGESGGFEIGITKIPNKFYLIVEADGYLHQEVVVIESLGPSNVFDIRLDRVVVPSETPDLEK